ncbi:uncharacterized protein LOC132293470 [Cornus florida]|uniref:uncharacterized protein LOC132293470 n=1 Tax=Cornus florida TaxID=4283 RepID=UPI00289FB7AA|nr:uncharacterized protein LOC132293470 [Cornus florida]
MSMMNLLLRNTINSNRSIQVGLPNQGLSLLLRDSRRHFSTTEAEVEQPTQDPPTNQFIQPVNKGFVYGKLFDTMHATKGYILNLLEGELTRDDIKVDYNRSFTPNGILIQFHSHSAFEYARKAIARKGRLFRLERVNPTRWDLLASYDGKAVLLQGIPRNALPDDVERFLSGCFYDASTLQFQTRQVQGLTDPIRFAVVRFRTQTEAMHCFITKNRGFCLNSQILLCVLQ